VHRCSGIRSGGAIGLDPMDVWGDGVIALDPMGKWGGGVAIGIVVDGTEAAIADNGKITGR